jgi:hypothetical protein
MRLVLLALLVPALLGGGCGPRPDAAGSRPGSAGDVVLDAEPAGDPDRVADGSLVLDGPARYETVTVGQAALLRAENAEQRAAAERALASGMHLGDPYRLLRLAPEPGRAAVAASPRAVPVGTPITAELLVRLDGTGPAPILRFEHAPTDPPEIAPTERRAPAAVGFELLPSADGRGYDRARLLLGGGRSWSEQEAIAVPSLDWRGRALRVGIALETDRVSLVVDGDAVLEQEVYVAGPSGAPRLMATATAANGASLLVMQWTSLVEGAEEDGEDD